MDPIADLDSVAEGRRQKTKSVARFGEVEVRGRGRGGHCGIDRAPCILFSILRLCLTPPGRGAGRKNGLKELDTRKAQ